MNSPLVSVLMTAYNREKYIAAAIDSVLASSYTNFELIITDDCSSDETVSIARGYTERDSRIRLFINEKNLGDYSNRNQAASYASGKYLKYVDSDDLIYPNGLQVMVDCMERFPEAGVGIVGRDPARSKELPVLFDSSEAYYSNFFVEGLFDTGPTGIIFNTDKFREIGGFSGKRFIGDIEINLRMAARWPVVKMPPGLVFWRKHDEQEFEVGTLLSTGYLESLLPVYEQELKKAECPLTPKQRKRVLNYYKRMSARSILKMILKDKKPGRALKIYQKLTLGPMDLLYSLFLQPIVK